MSLDAPPAATDPDLPRDCACPFCLGGVGAELALTTLRQGGVVAAATETFFGLLACAASRAAVSRVVALKGRDPSKGMALLLPHRASWGALVQAIPPRAHQLAVQFWPGPLTIALAAAPVVDPRLVQGGTVGVRLPGPSVAACLARAFGEPLTATSANRSGGAPTRDAGEVRALFQGEPALLVVEGCAPGGYPSTLIEIAGAQARILREGAVSRDRLTPFLSQSLRIPEN